MRKRNISLGLRTARNLVLLAGVLALGVALFQSPQLVMEGQLRAKMRDDGLTGQGELLWRGKIPFWVEPAYMTLLEEDGQIYAGRLVAYEDRPYTTIYHCEAPEKLVVAVVENNILDPQILSQYMALALPEEAERGRLTVELAPGDVRTVDSQREWKIMMFPIPCQEAQGWDYLWDQEALDGAAYTLTLWDGTGTVVSQTSGRLGSLWR